MSKTQPIRKESEIELLKNYYLVQKPNTRNYALITAGLNTALRISDILNLKWKEVYDFEKNCFLEHITIIERKTGKKTCIALNSTLREALSLLKEEKRIIIPEKCIFTGRTDKTHLSRSQAFRIIQKACVDLNLSSEISPHSLRKTFGYKAWNEGVNPVLIMAIYNHSSFEITKRYLGIEQEDKDNVYLRINI